MFFFSSIDNFNKTVVWLFVCLVGCRFESNCPLVGPGSIGGVPSVGVFLRDLALNYANFFNKMDIGTRNSDKIFVIKALFEIGASLWFQVYC